MSLPSKRRVFQPWWDNTPTVDLTSVPTRELLKSLQVARQRPWENEAVVRGHVVLVDQLKGELSKREHIPNKPEAQQIRCERAKSRNRRRQIIGHRRRPPSKSDRNETV
jgi:hypothetical protein